MMSSTVATSEARIMVAAAALATTAVRVMAAVAVKARAMASKIPGVRATMLTTTATAAATTITW
jgi:hypothetical protein